MTRTPHAKSLMVALVLLATAVTTYPASANQVTSFKLKNGMDLVVVPDRRAPIVTHMVWYRVGAADDPPGSSGTAHFLEHLMFKSTLNYPSGEYARRITRMGGRYNAVTTHDTTSYFVRAPKRHLGKIMRLEADRMSNLSPTVEEFKSERSVILAERRGSIDAEPTRLLDEQMQAALYRNHPYARPAIGWAHEISKLNLKTALSFYRRFYAPNNVVVIVVGDVVPEHVHQLALATYGRTKRNPKIERRVRASEPPSIAARRVALQHTGAGGAAMFRYYEAPNRVLSQPRQAESLELLAKIIGGDASARLYRHLVVDEGLATAAGSKYQGDDLDAGRMVFLAIARPGIPIDRIEKALDAVLDDVCANGVSEDELSRAKIALRADYIYGSDDQQVLARRYGVGLALGRSVADIDGLVSRAQSIRPEDIVRAAREVLTLPRSVTGTLMPAKSHAMSVGRTGAKAQ